MLLSDPAMDSVTAEADEAEANEAEELISLNRLLDSKPIIIHMKILASLFKSICGHFWDLYLG